MAFKRFKQFLLTLAVLLSSPILGFDQYEDFYDLDLRSPHDPLESLGTQSINIMTTSGRELICHPRGRGAVFQCEGGSFFAANRPFGPLIGVDQQGNYLSEDIDSLVSLDNEILGVRRVYDDPYFEEDPLYRLSSLSDDLSVLRQFQRDLPQLSELLPINNALLRERDQIQQALTDSTLNVTLEDGEELTCERSWEKSVPGWSSHSRSRQANQDIAPPEQCDILNCRGEHLPEDENVLLYNSASLNSILPERQSPVLIRTREGRLSGFLNAHRVTSSSQNTVLYEQKEAHPYSPNWQGGQTLASLAESIYGADFFTIENYDYVDNDRGRIANNHLMFSLSYLELMCLDGPQFIQNARADYEERAAQAQLVQAFTVLNDQLTSFYVDPQIATRHFCSHDGRFYSEEAFSRRDQHFAPDDQRLIVSADEAQELFEWLQGMDDIAFGYAVDGCYARAHLMARRLEERGLYVEKAWINGNLRVEQPPVNWAYHVAPALYVEGPNGEPQKMIFDPSLSDRPQSTQEWTSMMTSHLDYQVQETSFPFPENSINYFRASLAFSNSDPYYPNASTFGMSEEEKISAARTTMDLYLPLQ